jgi:hypothetical protein
MHTTRKPSTNGTCYDKETNEYVMVSGDMYSINGTEPQPIPEDLRGQEPRDQAKQILEAYLGRRRVA